MSVRPSVSCDTAILTTIATMLDPHTSTMTLHSLNGNQNPLLSGLCCNAPERSASLSTSQSPDRWSEQWFQVQELAVPSAAGGMRPVSYWAREDEHPKAPPGEGECVGNSLWGWCHRRMMEPSYRSPQWQHQL